MRRQVQSGLACPSVEAPEATEVGALEETGVGEQELPLVGTSALKPKQTLCLDVY